MTTYHFIYDTAIDTDPKYYKELATCHTLKFDQVESSKELNYALSKAKNVKK